MTVTKIKCKTLTSFGLSLLALTVFALTACKLQNGDPTKSETKTLDNLARNEATVEFKLNTCGNWKPPTSIINEKDIAAFSKWVDNDKHYVPKGDKPTKDEKQAIKDILEVVPKSISGAMLTDDLEIFISHKKNPAPCVAIAKETLSEKQQKENGVSGQFACWYIQGEKRGLAFGKGSITKIDKSKVEVSTEAAIRHSFLRSITALYTHNFINITVAESLTKQENPFGSGQIEKLVELKIGMADALAADTKANPKLLSLDRFDGDDNKLDEDEKKVLGSIAFVEAIDSARCSAKSHGDFQRLFPKTYALYMNPKK